MKKWRHLWVVLIVCTGALIFHGQASAYLTHFTSRGFEEVRSVSDFDSAYLKRLLGLSKNKLDKAEQSSIQHQKDVIHSVRGTLKSKLEKEGFLSDAFLKGVIDSDLGKLGEFKKLLTEKSKKSDHLFSFLKGQGDKKSKKILSDLLEKFPAHQRTLLNPSLSNDQIRLIFKKNPVLQHYLHEIVGIADPLHFFEAGVIGEKSFKDQLKTNLFHNGPHAGFWKFYSEVTIYGLVGKDKKARKFFLNTPYEGKKEKDGFISPKYPGPISFEGYVHVIFDRLSQGTRGGVDKIFEEIRKFPGQSDVEKMASLLFDNPRSTQEQLTALIELASEDTALSTKQQKVIIELIERCQSRLDAYISYVTKRIEFKVEGAAPVLVIRPSSEESIVYKTANNKLSISKNIAGQANKPPRFSDPLSFGDELKAKVITLLKEEESLNGDPLKDLDL